MARVCPALPQHAARSVGEAAERDVIGRLASGLPDAFRIFHGVDWSNGQGVTQQHGEVDVIVVNQAGDLTLLEVKSGNVEFTGESIVKRYGGQSKDVTGQARRQYAALRARLQRAVLPVRVQHMLVLPDVRVGSETVQWPRERIVDASDLDALPARVLGELGAGVPAPALRDRVVAFLENQFDVAPDVSAMGRRLQDASTRLASGLATWVPRITAPSGLIRVVGTAGSGKTQLALRLLRDADAQGLRATYLCFNRALADHIATIAPVRALAETFHEYAVRVCRQAGRPVDFASAGAFDRITQGCIDALLTSPPDLDLLVIDECQDLQPAWVEALLGRLKPSGRAVVLEDPGQQLYDDRVLFDLPEAVTVTSMDNFRTPRSVVGLINLLRLCDEPVVACAATEGEVSDPLTYRDDRQCAKATEQAVARCIRRGFELKDIAVVSMRGRARSVLQHLDRLGSWSVERFTGGYDAGGGASWTQGELLVESVRRFKGQAAPAVVLTECEFDELTPMQRRLLFVGLTRARMHLEWVMSDGSAAALARAVESG